MEPQDNVKRRERSDWSFVLEGALNGEPSGGVGCGRRARSVVLYRFLQFAVSNGADRPEQPTYNAWRYG
jgi:hypothetical protein